DGGVLGRKRRDQHEGAAVMGEQHVERILGLIGSGGEQNATGIKIHGRTQRQVPLRAHGQSRIRRPGGGGGFFVLVIAVRQTARQAEAEGDQGRSEGFGGKLDFHENSWWWKTEQTALKWNREGTETEPDVKAPFDLTETYQERRFDAGGFLREGVFFAALRGLPPPSSPFS